MSRWDNSDMDTFRMRVAEAIGDGRDPLDYLGRQWGGR